MKTLMCKKQVLLEDGTTFTKGLSLSKKNADTKKQIECLRVLLAQISGISKSNFEKVSCQNFGKFLSWFGPGQETVNKEQRNFLSRMSHICSQPWFHGMINNPDAILSGKPKEFMVRLSNEAGYFTIQTSTRKSRIVYTPTVGYYPDISAKKEVFQDMVTWVQSFMKDYTPCLNSEFSLIFGFGDNPQIGNYSPSESLVPSDPSKK